jgi:hypothetical protein
VSISFIVTLYIVINTRVTWFLHWNVIQQNKRIATTCTFPNTFVSSYTYVNHKRAGGRDGLDIDLWLDGSGFETRWGQDSLREFPGSTHSPVQWVMGLLPNGEATGFSR